MIHSARQDGGTAAPVDKRRRTWRNVHVHTSAQSLQLGGISSKQHMHPSCLLLLHFNKATKRHWTMDSQREEWISTSHDRHAPEHHRIHEWILKKATELRLTHPISQDVRCSRRIRRARVRLHERPWRPSRRAAPRRLRLLLEKRRRSVAASDRLSSLSLRSLVSILRTTSS